MSWAKRLGGRLPDFADVVRRFPVAVAIMAAFTVWVIYQNLFGRLSGDEMYIFGGFILAGYVAVIAQLISEARGMVKHQSLILSLTLATPAFCLGFFGKGLDFISPMAIAAAVLFLGNAAAWKLGRNDKSVWNFTQKLWTGAIFAVVGSLIFTAGMFAISEAVRALFGVNLNDLTIDTVLPIGLAFLAPIYWMGTLPRFGEAEDVAELSFEARALSFLGTWMLAPLVIIYALIILAYGLKILVQWELPKGEIAQLVTPFLGVGMLVWLMLEPKVLNEGGFVRFYRRVWHWVMLPVAILLAIAVFVRVQKYGFTIERFLLTLIVIWAFVQSILFALRPRTKHDIRIPTGSAAGLLLFGAFAAEPFSLMSQYQRATAAKAELGDFTASKVESNPAAAKVFLGGLRYIVKSEDETRFSKLLPGQDMPRTHWSEEWKSLVSSLNLDEVNDTPVKRRRVFTVASELPIEMKGNAQFFGSYPVRIFGNGKTGTVEGVVMSRSGLKVKLKINERIYPIDFGQSLESLDLVGENDSETDVIMPPIAVTALDGTVATLIVLDGYIAKYDGSFRDVTLDIALIVPN